MLRDAVNEIRLHPARFIATLLAIAISVGFLVAISTLTLTTQRATARDFNLALSQADVVVQADKFDGESLQPQIEKVDGVRAVEPAVSGAGILTHGDRSALVTIVPVPGEDFRWAEIKEGRYAEAPDEITLSSQAADQLDASVGTKLETSAETPPLTVVGITRDAQPLFTVLVYAQVDRESDTWVVKTDGASPEQVRDAIEREVSGVTVQTGEDARQEKLDELTDGFNIFRAFLYAFAGMALVVGVIIISNTFTILFTQRRRQIALLRAVGASTGQVRGRLVLEALFIGLLGSLLGVGVGLLVAWAGANYTGAAFWGLEIDWPQVAIAVGIGTLATLLSVAGPSLNATQVKPIEALQVVPSAAKAKRLGTLRVVVCSICLILGAFLVLLALTDTSIGLLWAILAGAALSVGILGMAPVYVPPILRVLGRIFGFAGPTVRLAAENSARNPRRAGATAVALMLAVGLVVTLQVGASTTRTSAMDAINEAYPVDLTVSVDEKELPDELRGDLERMPDAAQVTEVPVKQVTLDSRTVRVVNANPGWKTMGSGDVTTDDVALISEYGMSSQSVDLPGVGTVKLRKDKRVERSSELWVSESVFQQVEGQELAPQLWVKVKDRNGTEGFASLVRLLMRYPDVSPGGGYLMAGSLAQVVNIVLMVVTALLGVAVVIALVGVGNTLGLSVIERQRESALLRALGMQRSNLRLLLLVEALMLSLVGIIIGVLAGSFFGWMGVTSVVNSMEGAPEVHFSVDIPYTLGLIGICVLAACLASILPGRRAANATPTEALAAE